MSTYGLVTLLKPTWLAVASFVALPALFAVVVAVVVERIERPTSWTRRRPWVVALPVLLVVLVPPIVVVVAIAGAVLAAWSVVRQAAAVTKLHASRAYGLVVRSAWLAVALLGLRALISDISELQF